MKGSKIKGDACFIRFGSFFLGNEYLRVSWSEFSWVMISELENPYIHTNVAVCGESCWFLCL